MEKLLSDNLPFAALSYLSFEPDDIDPKLTVRLRAQIVQVDGEIYAAGDVSNDLFVLVDDVSARPGIVVEIFVEPDGTERTMIVERVVSGVCGEMEFVGRDESGRFPPRMFSARALTPGRLIRIPYRALLALDAPQLALIDRRLAATTVGRFRNATIAADAGRATNRVAILASAILQLAEDAGIEEGGGRRITVKKTQKQLADEVGLTREVVNGHLNEWVRAGLLSIEQGLLSVRDLDRFRRIVELQRSQTRGVHQRALQKVDLAIAAGDSFRARNLALEALRFFAESPELQHRVVLASARCGARDEAAALIEQFGFAAERPVADIRRHVLDGLRNPLRKPASEDGDVGSDDDDNVATASEAQAQQRLGGLMEDILALPARVLKDMAWSGRDVNLEIATQAQAAYERAYRSTSGPYVGINAASLALVCGNRERAHLLATELLGKTPVAKYWSLATQGEALALLGRWPEAAHMFDQAMKAKDATPAAVASTRLQMRRLSGCLGAPAKDLLEHLPQTGVIAFSGHMMLGHMAGEDQTRATAQLAPQITDAIKQLHAGFAYGALAAGSDILLAEGALAANVALHTVLPFRVEDFLDVSVNAGVPGSSLAPDWRGRFADCLSRANSLTITSRERMVGIAKADLDDMFRIGNRRALGLALLKADELVTEPTLLVVHDGNPPQNVAGTAFLVQEAKEAGIRVETLACGWRGMKPNTKVAPSAVLPVRSVHRPVLFLWLAPTDTRRKTDAQIAELQMAAERLVRTVLGSKLQIERRVVRSTALGLVVGFSGCDAALRAVFELRNAAKPDTFSMRMICDFGPVGAPETAFNDDRLSRLDGANDIPGLPVNMVIASEAFAAEARLSTPDVVRFRAVGRVSPEFDRRNSLPLPSIPLYRAVLLADGSGT